jgi:hypothetical protein
VVIAAAAERDVRDGAGQVVPGVVRRADLDPGRAHEEQPGAGGQRPARVTGAERPATGLAARPGRLPPGVTGRSTST